MEENNNNENKIANLSEEELLKKVEKAASKGVSKAGIKNALLSAVPTIVVIGLIASFIIPKYLSFNEKISSIFHFDSPADQHDLVLENNGVFGYLAADFEEAILGDSSKLKKIEVFEQEVSDAGTVVDTGLLNWGIFTKNQLITYTGKVVYTVDMSGISKSDIEFNEEEKIITLRIPHAVQENINIPEDKIQYGDTNGGLLAFGELKATAEQLGKVQAEARKKMEEKLVETNTLETADRFAKLVVWEMYSPIIKGVAKDYSLEVEFK